MTVRRIVAIALLLAALVAPPVISAAVNLAAGALALILLLGLAVIVATWRPRPAYALDAYERRVHEALAQNLTPGDPL